MSNHSFQYTEAFSRNIGLLTHDEQEKLRTVTIAIPGMGAVGSAHFMACVRQGFEKFKIADLDVYELKNFNRQYGARQDTIGRPKVQVMKEEALKINPQCTIEIFEEGINAENIETFLKDVDLAFDGLDAFVIDVRRMFYRESLARGIPVLNAGPIGFGTAFLVFMPGGPTFDEYFALTDSMSELDKTTRFFVGLVPALLQRRYMKGVNIDEKRGPSSIGAVDLCAGIAVINALKIVLHKGTVKAVPYYQQFDAMRNKYVVKRLYFGNRNPLQKIKIKIAKYLARD